MQKPKNLGSREKFAFPLVLFYQFERSLFQVLFKILCWNQNKCTCIKESCLLCNRTSLGKLEIKNTLGCLKYSCDSISRQKICLVSGKKKKRSGVGELSLSKTGFFKTKMRGIHMGQSES